MLYNDNYIIWLCGSSGLCECACMRRYVQKALEGSGRAFKRTLLKWYVDIMQLLYSVMHTFMQNIKVGVFRTFQGLKWAFVEKCKFRVKYGKVKSQIFGLFCGIRENVCLCRGHCFGLRCIFGCIFVWGFRWWFCGCVCGECGQLLNYKNFIISVLSIKVYQLTVLLNVRLASGYTPYFDKLVSINYIDKNISIFILLPNVKE